MGNSMYDKNEIEDSLEFCRQIKEYEDISATDKGTANESQDKSLSVMAEEMETQSHSWDHILQEQDPVSVDFDAVKPFIAPPESETSAKAMGGLLEKEEEAKRIQEKQREQARQKALARAEAAKKENEEAVRLKAEQERKAAEEAARLKAEQERKAAEEAARLKAEQERKAAEEAARLKAEQERKAAKEAALEQHRHELELQNKLQQQRAETEALARKQQQLEEAEAQRIAQAQREAVARTRAKLQQQRQQELAKQQETLRQQELAKQESIRRQELERQREVQARQEAMRLREQEKQARQLAAKQEQLQREEEARAHAAAMEQARQQMEVQSRKQADQAEQLRLRIEAQKQQTEQEQLRIEQEQQQRIQKQREAESAARETFIQSNSSLAAERQRAAMEAEAEARILQERAEELKRQAEVAALEARIHQLEQESARARGEYAASYGTQSATQQPVYTDPLAQNRTQQPVYTDPRTQNTAQQMYTGTSASGYPGQTQTAAGSVSKQKLSEKQINEIFAQGLEKERKESRAKRNALIQRQADKENARIRQERAENGVKPPVERVLDMVKVGKDKAVDILSDVFHTVKEKSEDPELQEQKTKASRLFGNLLVIAICVFIAYCVASVVTSFVVNPTKVEGESMESTLTNGDTVLIQKMSYYFGDPKRYDVVVFPVPYYNSDTKYIKRVIGLPGETVQIIEGKVYINGKELKDDTYGKDKVIDDPGDAVEPITLADDEYFVLGDNRNMSTDSRSSYVGLIRRKSIIGKACARIFPLSKMGGIAG